MKKFLKYSWKTVKWIFIVFFVFTASLYFREQRLPKAMVSKITERLSTPNMLLTCEGATVGLKRGVTLAGVKVYDRRREHNVEPVASATMVSISHLQRTVRIVGAKFTRLHDGYYKEGCREKDAPLAFEFPDLPEFRLILESPDLLGLRPERVTTQLHVKPKWLAADEVHILWPDRDRLMTMDGYFRFDLHEQRIKAEVHGLAMQRHIRPLLETLDSTSVLPYIDAFTEITEPVPAKAEFDVSLVNNDFGLKLDLKPVMGRYNGAAMSRAEGLVGFNAETRGTNSNVRLDVEIPLALDPEGRKLEGKISVISSNRVIRLGYDFRSELKFEDALAVSDFLTPADLDMVTCESAPVLTVKGLSGVKATDIDDNRIDFTTTLKHGAFYGFRLNDLSMDYALVRDRLVFTNVVATGRCGGRYTGSGVLDLPGFDSARASFGIKVKCEKGSLEEYADAFKFDLGERRGQVDGECWFTAPASTNFASRLNGGGIVRITDGHLGQMKLFAGLTKLLADKVPGVGFLVNQSQARCTFTVTDGVLSTDNLFIEGGFISIKAWGRYDIAKDDLDFTVRVQFLKDESLMGKVVHPITWPFTKLLLEFKAKGPLDDPKWEYISIIDRIL